MSSQDELLLKHIAVHEAGHLLACAVWHKNLESDPSFIIQIDQDGLDINGVKASGHVRIDLSAYEKQKKFKVWLMINYLIGYRADLFIHGAADEASFESDKACWNTYAAKNYTHDIEQRLIIFKQHTQMADDLIRANKAFIEEVAKLLLAKKTLIYQDVESLLNHVKLTPEFAHFTTD